MPTRRNLSLKKENNMEKISFSSFYGEFHGHPVEQLPLLLNHLRNVPSNKSNTEGILPPRPRQTIFLVGDSSMDNKHWFSSKSDAVNGYETILKPPKSREDVCYWINYEINKRGLGSRLCAVNAAVEESRIESRACSTLLPHDKFVQDNILDRREVAQALFPKSIKNNDILIVSVGGNDIALGPMPCTILNMLCLINCTTLSCMENCTCPMPLSAVPCYACDDRCGGCSTSCLASCFGGCPLGIGYFIHLFRTRLETYIQNLVAKHAPSLVVVNMIYYPEEKYARTTTGGCSRIEASDKGYCWADPALAALGYNSDPKKLQLLIRNIYKYATKNIRIKDPKYDLYKTATERESGLYIPVVTVPMYEILDSTVHTDSAVESDYVARVEPSVQGGHKLAVRFVDEIEKFQQLQQQQQVADDASGLSTCDTAMDR